MGPWGRLEKMAGQIGQKRQGGDCPQAFLELAEEMVDRCTLQRSFVNEGWALGEILCSGSQPS